ncbi:MAG TPA: tetratricopeptide repeat protein [Thermoanaerobaculia bacterium]|nr:tetratricopeptide repeat protein [Thermoanaerobaculia bacterium]
MRKSIVLSFLAFTLAMAGNVFAIGEARITGRVLDPSGKAIADASIEVTATEGKTFKNTFKTGKDGRFAIFLLDGTIHYKFVFSKEGFAPYEEVMKLKLSPERNSRDFTLGSGAVAAPAADTKPVPAKDDPAVAYNAGAALANAGKRDEAIAKFEEAVKMKPGLTAGWIALTNLYAQKKDWKKAVEAGNKVLAVDPDNADVNTIMSQAYTAMGDKTKASEFKKKAPANATALFNDAAKEINAGRDSEAEPLLKQAISADPKMAGAYYELGMIYVRMAKNAEARTNLQQYLALQPNGKDAATAKEMMSYLK